MTFVAKCLSSHFLIISLKSAGTNDKHPTTPQTLDEVSAGNQIGIQIW